MFGGAVGGGKSETLLMGALQYVDIPGYAALLIRDTYRNLSMEGSLIDRSISWLMGTDAKWNEGKKRWTFPSGSTLSFGYLDSPNDHFNYQSSEFQYIGIDEVVNIRENQATYMFSRIRRKTPEAYYNDLKKLPKFKRLNDEQIDYYYKEYSNIPLRYRCASNPPTREQLKRGLWVKKKYIAQDTREEGVVFIPSKLEDNRYVDTEEYEKSLDKLDEITREQLRHGNWNIQVEGIIFQKERLSYYDAKTFGLKDIRKLRTICILDPANAQGKESSDFPAVIWLAILPDGFARLFYNLDEKISLDEAIDKLAELNFQFWTKEVIYETNGTMLLDKTIRDAHKRVAKRLGIKNPVSVEGFHHSSNKINRIIAMQPLLYNGFVQFRGDYEKFYPELMNQLVNFLAWPNDDFPDAIEFGLWYLQDQGFSFMGIPADGIQDIDLNKEMNAVIPAEEAVNRIKTEDWGLFGEDL